jgi:blocked-early-in-transport protein 1
MASRYGSHLTQREGRSSLFSSYDNRQASTSPSKNRPGSGYSSRYGGDASVNQSQSAFGAYPNGGPSASPANQFRSATPDKKGRYSDAVLSELESQNDEHISGILGKVGQLKQVSDSGYYLTIVYLLTG